MTKDKVTKKKDKLIFTTKDSLDLELELNLVILLI